MTRLAKTLWLSLAVLLASSSCGRGPNIRYGQIYFDQKQVRCFDRKNRSTIYSLPKDEAAITCVPNMDLSALLTACRTHGGGAEARFCQIYTDLELVKCWDRNERETDFLLPSEEASLTCLPNIDLNELLKYCRIKN